MERRTRKPVTNEANPKDHIGRAPRAVKDDKHKGRMPKAPKKPPTPSKRRIAVPGGNKK